METITTTAAMPPVDPAYCNRALIAITLRDAARVRRQCELGCPYGSSVITGARLREEEAARCAEVAGLTRNDIAAIRAYGCRLAEGAHRATGLVEDGDAGV